MDAAVGAHGHGSAEDVGAFGGAGAEGEDVGDGGGGGGGFLEGAFAQSDGFFDGEFVEGVHAVFYAGGLDGGEGFVDAGFDLRGRGEWG